MGRVERVLVDNDAKGNTGKAQTDNGSQSVNGIDQVWHYDYSLKGELIELRKDNNVDGTADYREVYTLDEASGRIKQKEIDLTNNGLFDKKEVYESTVSGGKLEDGGSVNGLLKTSFYNISTSGSDILTKIEYYEVNANNQRIKLFRNTDAQNSGTTHSVNNQLVNGIDRIESYTLDAYGQTIKTEFNLDADLANTIDKVDYFTRNTNGYISRTEIDVTNDNSRDIVYDYKRNEKGEITEQLKYFNINGVNTLATREIYERDVNGFVTKETLYMGDSNNPVNSSTYIRNSQGQVSKTLTDTDGNGSIDIAETHNYDEQGRKISTARDVGNDGSIERNTHYGYDANGYLITEIRDDGEKRVFTRDIQGNDLRVELSKNGEVIYAVDKKFNAVNQTIEEIVDRDGKGLGTNPTVKDERYVHTYDAQGRQAETKSYIKLTENDSTGIYDFTATREFDSRGNTVVETYNYANGDYTKVEKSYDTIWSAPSSEKSYSREGELTHETEFVFDHNGNTIYSFADSEISRVGIEKLDFGRHGGYSTIDHKEDLTQWNTEQLAKITGLKEILLSQPTYRSELVLDIDTIKKLAPKDTNYAIRISGDSTDTVSIKNELSDFQKTANAEGSRDMYVFEDAGTRYHLFIDNDVNVSFG